MFKKVLIITAVLFSLLVSSPASAQIDNTSDLPEFNPFCWHRKDCHKIRKQFLISDPPSCTVGDPACKELEQGFITAGVAPCEGGIGPEQWGRCLPAGKTKTEISFGGSDTFNNIGDFLVVMYKYLLTIASIVAVVMIIIAGAQWITSGGNSEAISSAKKRIGGAIIGLFIAYMSYFVLNTINPALVNLRLPQVWLVKPQSLTPEYCKDIENADEAEFMFGADPAEQTKPITIETAKEKGGDFTLTKPEDFECGSRYFVASGGKSPCRGRACSMDGEDQLTCFNKEGDRKNYECGHARVYGTISYSALTKCGLLNGIIGRELGAASWDCPPVDAVRLLVVCTQSIEGDGESLSFGYGYQNDSGHFWIDSRSSNVESDVMMTRCEGGSANVKGFVVKFKMIKNNARDELHYIGKDGIDLGSYGSGAVHNLYKVDEKHLLSLDELLNGIRVDVDVADIEDTDSVTEKNKSYWEQQYQ